MSKFLDKIIERAKTDKQKIVLPEGSDIRTVQAARVILDAGIADVIILGSESEVTAHGIDVSDATVIDPRTSELLESYAQKFVELRKKKGVTINEAREQMKDELKSLLTFVLGLKDESYFGVMMVYMDDADGMVSGACHSTADTLRPALQILKTAPGTELVSSFFVEDVPDCSYGDDGLFVFADCALNIYPSAEELAEIAIASAESFKQLCGGEPRVAMLSYSSYGSGKGESVEKMAEATRIAKERAPQLQLDGELQVDAAIVDTVAALKAPDSPVAGKANVLIFPNIDAGNIAYKLVQRLAKADAFGPILQGVAKPVNDLSRGCSADDIVGTVAVTCVQSQARKAQS